MKTQTTELQLHEAELIYGRVKVSYSLVDDEGIANVEQQINPVLLYEFIEDKGLNDIYSDDEVLHLDARIYLSDNVRKVVTLFLEDILCA